MSKTNYKGSLQRLIIKVDYEGLIRLIKGDYKGWL